MHACIEYQSNSKSYYCNKSHTLQIIRPLVHVIIMYYLYR